MKRLLPHPVMAGFLLAVWLLLADSVSGATLVAGIVFAVGLAWLFAKLEPPGVRLRRPGLLVALLARVLLDITRSNLAVARLVATGRARPPSGFVVIPLELTQPYALAMLACIITATPGTIWVSHDSARRLLVIHVLDLVDEDTWIAGIKRRYERPLLEIFR